MQFCCVEGDSLFPLPHIVVHSEWGCGCLGCCGGACKQAVMVEVVSILYVEVLEGGLEVVLCG